MSAPEPEPRTIALRAYAAATTPRPPLRRPGPPLRPSGGVLVFDTETSIDAAQQLRVGAYQLRRNGRRIEAGLFYDPASLSEAERARVTAYAERHRLQLMDDRVFVDGIFFAQAYAKRYTILGFNLPFDISRLALAHASARGEQMRGGFSFRLSEDTSWPRVQVRHLNSRTALIRFTARPRQRRGRGQRRRGLRGPAPRRGYFVDLRSLAAALTGSGHSLASLARLLGTRHQKLEAAHGEELGDEYLDYLCRDVQTSWECYVALSVTYDAYTLPATLVSQVKSEASIGKATLREMGLRTWRERQADYPPWLVGTIMSSYFGGRSEVHLRRTVAQVLYLDFRSMYPTISTLQGLWRHVAAERLVWHEETAQTRAFVENVSLADLARPETWLKLNVLVQVIPKADLFPVRAAYDARRPHFSIGLNFLSSRKALWFTLADVVVAKLLTGRTPTIRRALAFEAIGTQDGLQAVELLGKADYRFDPTHDDLPRRLIELRGELKDRAARADDPDERARLAAEAHALKIVSNATCYGIFIELNVTEQAEPVSVAFYGRDGRAHTTELASLEKPGRYFHPLIGTLTTAGARLMLALVERLAAGQGLEWAFCDTDSMALARPERMDEHAFYRAVTAVQEWFEHLNPYSSGELLKREEANYDWSRDDPCQPLYCLAVSAKRYALFNLDERGLPVLRKASAHGLGHLVAPYDASQAPAWIGAPRFALAELGVERWQHDLWWCVALAALGDDPNRVELPSVVGLSQPAVSTYAATTPRLLEWFATFNAGRPYREQVRPFGFMSAYQAKSLAQRVRLAVEDGERLPQRRKRASAADLPRAVSPYAKPGEAVAAFDRETGEAVPRSWLKSYRQALARYHLQPEAKFVHGDYRDAGLTRRRHIEVAGVVSIGKEANRWEEQLYLGEDPQAQIIYGEASADRERQAERLRVGIARHGVRRMAAASGLSLGLVSGIGRGAKPLSSRSAARLATALAWLDHEHRPR